MPEPALTDSLLAEIEARDELAGEGLMTFDTSAALDRHTLLVEVRRQQELIERLRSGRPVSLREE